MKHLLILFLVILMGCASFGQTLDEYRDQAYSEKATGHSLYYGSFSEIQTLGDISTWIMTHIYYKADETDSWDNPRTVLERGYGDCDDFALLVMNIAYVRFGLEFDLVLVDTTKMKTIEEGGNINHASVAIGDYVFNVYDLNQYATNVPIAFRYSFWEVFDLKGDKSSV